jgi:hypothetical protein
MSKIEIQKPEWKGFFNTFSKQHKDWLVTVEVNDTGNPKIIGKSLPLRGITADGKDREIILILSNERDEHYEHIIHAPESVTLEQTGEGAHKELSIKSQDGVITVLKFVTVALPETVDGVVFS